MKSKTITLEVVYIDTKTGSYVDLINTNGDTFEIMNNHRNEELIDFIGRAESKLND
jgi:hypothetical protein